MVKSEFSEDHSGDRMKERDKTRSRQSSWSLCDEVKAKPYYSGQERTYPRAFDCRELARFYDVYGRDCTEKRWGLQ